MNANICPFIEMRRIIIFLTYLERQSNMSLFVTLSAVSEVTAVCKLQLYHVQIKQKEIVTIVKKRYATSSNIL